MQTLAVLVFVEGCRELYFAFIAPQLAATGSAEYWERRYQSGGNSGAGSYGYFAEHKATYINDLVEKKSVKSVNEMGSGDCSNLKLYHIPIYHGFDVSQKSIEICEAKFGHDHSKSFLIGAPSIASADLSMSLDVLYHLVEQEVFETYLKQLFASARKYVLIYAFDGDEDHSGDLRSLFTFTHVKFRAFTTFVTTNFPAWRLLEKHEDSGHVDNRCVFFLYEKQLM